MALRFDAPRQSPLMFGGAPGGFWQYILGPLMRSGMFGGRTMPFNFGQLGQGNVRFQGPRVDVRSRRLAPQFGLQPFQNLRLQLMQQPRGVTRWLGQTTRQFARPQQPRLQQQGGLNQLVLPSQQIPMTQLRNPFQY